ncbi:hypothetical protein LO772_32820 [Yinghuangia sp. ASG 101]|uniref:hypothetical protein n=1 Tax=Yinghuangia sp. ASG 101 TaxID=2896848 RepID=UPI001E2AC2BF|nr:hypothetical protein [Yinghuangia sp. ASG 101]UGQ11512.1 hypothetical protein LO772_32820 [Yinghuangia sp. ASG 101]
MIYLGYTFRPTPHALANQSEFWSWVRDREKWFYGGLDMVLRTDWYVRTIGSDVHCVEHLVAFADEAAWGAYRAAVSQRGRDKAWEERRIEQGLWYDIVDSRILSDPPVHLGLTAGD